VKKFCQWASSQAGGKDSKKHHGSPRKFYGAREKGRSREDWDGKEKNEGPGKVYDAKRRARCEKRMYLHVTQGNQHGERRVLGGGGGGGRGRVSLQLGAEGVPIRNGGRRYREEITKKGRDEKGRGRKNKDDKECEIDSSEMGQH